MPNNRENWQRFTHTGSIDDYLKYTQDHSLEVSKNKNRDRSDGNI